MGYSSTPARRRTVPRSAGYHDIVEIGRPGSRVGHRRVGPRLRVAYRDRRVVTQLLPRGAEARTDRRPRDQHDRDRLRQNARPSASSSTTDRESRSTAVGASGSLRIARRRWPAARPIAAVILRSGRESNHAATFAPGRSRSRPIAATVSVAVWPGPRSSQSDGTRIVPRSTGFTSGSTSATASASKAGRTTFARASSTGAAADGDDRSTTSSASSETGTRAE